MDDRDGDMIVQTDLRSGIEKGPSELHPLYRDTVRRGCVTCICMLLENVIQALQYQQQRDQCTLR